MSVIREAPFPGGKRVYIPRYIFAEMQELTNACELEVGALGLVSLEDEGIVLRELFIPTQMVGAAHAQISGAMQLEAQAFFFSTGKIEVEDEKNFVRFNWHSHVDYEAEFSPPDKVQSASMGGKYGENDPPWWISMVQNRKGSYQVYLELFKPIRRTLDITQDIIIGHPAHTSPLILSALQRRVTEGRLEDE